MPFNIDIPSLLWMAGVTYYWIEFFVEDYVNE